MRGVGKVSIRIIFMYIYILFGKLEHICEPSIDNPSIRIYNCKYFGILGEFNN